MTQKNKNPENSITDDIIRKVHLTLADLKTGEEILGFLRSTEPVFMTEVNRFIKTEISRMRYQLSETQSLYIGSVIGAAYIAGFLIAREAASQVFNGLLPISSDIKQVLSSEEIDKIIDSGRDAGKTYKEIARNIRKMIEKENKDIVKKKIKPKESDRGKRLDIGELD